MRNRRTEANRPLEDGAPDRPTRAWIEWSDGSHTDLRLIANPADRLAWKAMPHGKDPVVLSPGAHLRLDRLPAGGSVTFERVLRPTTE